MAKKSNINTKKAAFLISLLTCLITVILLVAFFVLISSPGVIDKLTDFNLVSLLLSDSECLESNCEDSTTSLISENSISIKDAWGFQSSLYQTIITFLIAINGFIAALSVLYIKNNSEEKAENAAKNYVKSDSFNVHVEKILTKKSRKKLRQLQSDYSSTIETFDLGISRINEVNKNLKYLENENIELKRQVNIISKRLAELDINESEGGALELNRSKK